MNRKKVVKTDAFLRDLKADWWKLANLISLSRLVACVALVALIIFFPHNIVFLWIAFILGCYCVVTDWLDGRVARAKGEVTDLGKRLDQYSDKIFILLTLFAIGVKIYHWVFWLLAFIAIREIDVTIQRVRANKVIAAKLSGKIKMVCQSINVLWLLWPYGVFGNPLMAALTWLISLTTVVVTYWSWYDYRTKKFKKHAM